MFGTVNTTMGGTSAFGNTAAPVNPMKDFEVSSPPEDTISSMEFSPATLQQNFLIAGSWDSSVRCWEVQQTGQTNPKSMKTVGGPVLDICWQDDGSKVYMASTDKQVKCWDLASDAVVQVAQHDAPIKTCHWVKGPNYTCLMTGSWDKTLKFWDTRTPTPIMNIALPERCYCADVDYPMAVVGTAGRYVIVYSLENKPAEFKRHESPLKYQHRTVAIFKDKKKAPTGYALGSIEGRVAIQYVNPTTPRDNFTFKCHRSSGNTSYQDIYAVNDIAFHPVHGTLATVGSDGTFSFWDKDARTKLKSSETMEQSITKCAFNSTGQIFAYAVGYDWSKVSGKRVWFMFYKVY
jgi:mRNA export factor